ncbi:hypothetical protein JOE31_000811 [Arthrobacter sp. PvP023]|nr:hypothetical protein [Arthrobacter sp. PvP023]
MASRAPALMITGSSIRGLWPLGPAPDGALTGTSGDGMAPENGDVPALCHRTGGFPLAQHLGALRGIGLQPKTASARPGQHRQYSKPHPSAFITAANPLQVLR